MQTPARSAVESHSHGKALSLLVGYLLLQSSGTSNFSQGLSLCCSDRSLGSLKNPNLSLRDAGVPNIAS